MNVLGVLQQVEIMAFMKAKGFQPRGRGAKGRVVCVVRAALAKRAPAQFPVGVVPT